MEGDSLEDMLFGSLSQNSLNGLDMDCESSEEMLDEGLESDDADGDLKWEACNNELWEDDDPDAEMLVYDEVECETGLPQAKHADETPSIVKNKYTCSSAFRTRAYVLAGIGSSAVLKAFS